MELGVSVRNMLCGMRVTRREFIKPERKGKRRKTGLTLHQHQHRRIDGMGRAKKRVEALYNQVNRLEETVGLAHGGLDVERLDVLPLLLEKRDQEVDGKHDVGEELVVRHLDVTDGDTKAENLLELELDGALNFGDLLLEVLVVRDGGGELAGLGETGAQETRNLLDQSFGSKESVVLLGELLDELLVLVELLQVLDGHELEVDELSTVDIGGIGENAEAHTRTRDMGKLDGTRETLVTLGVVVLEADLEFDGLVEVSALVLGSLNELLEGVTHAGHLNLAHLDVVGEEDW